MTTADGRAFSVRAARAHHPDRSAGELPATPWIGRADALRAVQDAISGSAGGALIVGPNGIGKSALVQQALASLAEEVLVLTVRGSTVSAKTPYGAYAWLLSDLPDEVYANPMLVLQGLAALIAKRAQGRRVVLWVDNAEELDQLAVMATSQLSRQNAVTLVVTTTDVLRSGDEILRLWTDGSLQRIDLGPLLLEEARELLAAHLGGRVSVRAARALWQETAGNPYFLILMCREQTDAGSLVQQDGIWVLAEPLVHSGELVDVMTSRLHRLPSEHRKLMEILSFVIELPLAVALRLVQPDTVDRLEERGAVQIVAGQVPLVRISHGLTAVVVASHVPFGRSRELWEEVSALIGQDQWPPASLVGYASWTLDCGAVLEPQLALRAARLANAAGDSVSALRYLDAVPEIQRSPDAVSAEVTALISAGQHDRALKLLDAVPPPEDPGEAVGWISLKLLHSSVLRTSWHRHAEAGQVLTDLERVVLEEPHSAFPTSAGDELRAEILMARSELAAYEGRYRDVPSDVLALFEDHDRAAELRVRAGALLCEVYAATGQQPQMEELAQRLMVVLRENQLPAPARADAYQRIFQGYFLVGDLAVCRRLVGEDQDTARVRHQRGSGGELATGLLHAAAGRSDVAMESLLPALSQLTVRDTDDVLPLATAVTGYAYALQGNRERAARYLVQSREFQQRPSWQAQQLAQYFHAAAAAILAGMKPDDGPLPSGAEPAVPVPAGNGFIVPTPEEAADQLCLLAEQAKERSAAAVAMACLAPAARLGNATAATQLEQIARSLPGSSAAMFADLAAGLLRDDAEALLRTARTAQLLDNILLAHEAARQAHAVAAKVGDRSLMRTARTMENDSFRHLRHAHSIDQRLSQLSKFELELAQLAASGESSAGMGQRLSLSPRTVDWHLGRIFEKLHVSGRAELRQVLE